ncbi:hypothetical protein [Streptomyces sp. TLI_171]|uniref:hypothetical protein n=1 Tax=Streptomyces sp. TLI_171 TaxID=1938859 RepID=UPI000C187D06|nr:hypothetical protein [Streptomyces sp. TLI_171]RKE02892.1 hypothetical protein BX266_7494 [Streptomyces sp. TLI_171]
MHPHPARRRIPAPHRPGPVSTRPAAVIVVVVLLLTALLATDLPAADAAEIATALAAAACRIVTTQRRPAPTRTARS